MVPCCQGKMETEGSFWKDRKWKAKNLGEKEEDFFSPLNETA